MFNTKNTDINNVSNNNIIIIYIFIFSDIEYQLDNKTIGVIIVVSNIKYMDIPSTPKYIFRPLNSFISWINWKSRFEKSNNINIIKDSIKFKIDIIKAVIFMFNILLFIILKKLNNIKTIPIKGTHINKINIITFKLYINIYLK